MPVPFKKILCPIDFDENSALALDKAAELARPFGCSLIVLHVVPLVLSMGKVPSPAAMYEDQEKAARAKLTDIAKTKLAGLKNELQVYGGDVIEGILSAQRKHQCDLVVMATHGHRGLARMFLGSVAEAVVRKASCPVLTIRPELPAARAVRSKSKPKAGNARTDQK